MPDWILRTARGIGLCLVLAAVFTWLGVYNSDNLPMPYAFGMWFMTMIIGGGSSLVVIPWILKGPIGRMHAAAGIVTAAALISIPITFALMFISGSVYTLYQFSIQYLYVFIISLVITTVGWTTDLYDYGTGTLKTGPGNDDNGPSPTEKFLSRLPVKYRTAELWALCSEDHYLRVYTSLGEELILMRLSDAVKELDHSGLQVHRSWWVAEKAVRDSSKDKGKLRLHLPDETEVPVSRSYQAEVQAAGLV